MALDRRCSPIILFFVIFVLILGRGGFKAAAGREQPGFLRGNTVAASRPGAAGEMRTAKLLPVLETDLRGEEEYRRGEEVIVTASLNLGGRRLPAGQELKVWDFNLLLQGEDGSKQVLALFDDGHPRHGDFKAADGIWSNRLVFKREGAFDVALQARGTYRGREFSLEKNLGRSAVFAPGTVFLHLPRLEHRSLPGKKISVPLQLTSTSSLKETIALAGQVEAGRFAASRIVLAPGESKTVRLDLYLFGDLGYGVHRFPLVFSAEDALTTLEPSPLELTLEIVTPGRAFIQNISRFFVRARLPLLILGLAGLIIYAGGLFLYRFLVLPRKKVQGILLYWRTGGSRIERKLPRRLRLSSLHKEEIVINFGPGDSRADLNLHGGDCVSDLLIKTVWISRRPLFLQGWRALLEKHLPVRTVLECTPPGIFEYEGDILTRKELLHADRFKAGGFSFEYRDPGGGWFRNKAKGTDVLEGKV